MTHLAAESSYAFLRGRNFTTSYAYDAGSNRTGFTDPEGGSTSYAYDTLNRLATLTPPAAISGGSFGFSYDALSSGFRSPVDSTESPHTGPADADDASERDQHQLQLRHSLPAVERAGLHLSLPVARGIQARLGAIWTSLAGAVASRKLSTSIGQTLTQMPQPMHEELALVIGSCLSE